MSVVRGAALVVIWGFAGGGCIEAAKFEDDTAPAPSPEPSPGDDGTDGGAGDPEPGQPEPGQPEPGPPEPGQPEPTSPDPDPVADVPVDGGGSTDADAADEEVEEDVHVCVPPEPCACTDGEVCDPKKRGVCVDGDKLRVCRVQEDGCSYLAEIVLCDDGIACTGNESCTEGFCVPGIPPASCCTSKLECGADDNVCNGVEACDVSTGTCTNGLPLECDDGNQCNGQEICDPLQGCRPGVPLDCASKDDDNICNGKEYCEPLQGCVSSPPLLCADDVVCNGEETCDPKLGCVPDPSPPEGCCLAGPCDDGKICNGTSKCDARTWTCTTTTPTPCEDGNVCNGISTCDNEIGCFFSVLPFQCNDGNPCNGLETCEKESGCVFDFVECDDDNACSGLEYCDPTTGCHSLGALACIDDNPCNGAEKCDPLVGCVAGVPVDCDDGKECTTDSCNENGACDHEKITGCVEEPLPPPTYCDDAKPIFAAKCTPCHTGGSSGGHNIGKTYLDAKKQSGACPDKPVGACAVIRIKNGTMPLGKGCGGPVPDADPSADSCVTESELEVLEAWVAGGMPKGSVACD